jgi:hypothetical protein
MFLTNTTTWRLPGTAWWKLQVMATPEASRLFHFFLQAFCFPPSCNLK